MFFIFVLLLILLNFSISYKFTKFYITTKDGLKISIVNRNNYNVSKPPLVFIHGSNSGGWIYDKHWLNYFSENKWSSYSVSMRGSHQTGVLNETSKVSFLDHLSDLDDIINYFNLNFEKPIIIAHSYSGLILTKYFEKINNRDKVSGAIWLCSLPPSGERFLILRYILRFKKILKVVKRVLQGSLENKIDIEKLLFYDDKFDLNKVEEYINLFELDRKTNLDLKLIDDNLPNRKLFEKENKWIQKDNKLIIGSYNDFILDPISVRETSKLVNSNSPIFLKNSGHNLMLDTYWKEAANVILDFLNKYTKYKY